MVSHNDQAKDDPQCGCLWQLWCFLGARMHSVGCYPTLLLPWQQMMCCGFKTHCCGDSFFCCSLPLSRSFYSHMAIHIGTTDIEMLVVWPCTVDMLVIWPCTVGMLVIWPCTVGMLVVWPFTEIVQYVPGLLPVWTCVYSSLRSNWEN